MRVNPDELPGRLQRDSLPPAILLFGEEPLLVEESAVRVRDSARQQGFNDRIPLNAEKNFDWGRLHGSSQTLSLFAERRLLELRLPTGRPGDAGARAFEEYCQAANDDVLLLVITGRLDAKAKQAKWVKTLDAAGWVAEHRELKPGQFQQWFRRRLRDRGLNLDDQVITRMCHFLEGNLLAAAQEIDRVALFADTRGRVEASVVSEGLADHARYNAFALTEALLMGDTRRALRVLNVLENEGVEPVIITWALSRDLHALVRIQHGLARGEQKNQLLRSNGIWSTRAPQVSCALARLGEAELRDLVRQLARCDRVMKGREKGDFWKELDVLAMMMCDANFVAANRVMIHAAG